jgi:hypothetical protein
MEGAGDQAGRRPDGQNWASVTSTAAGLGSKIRTNSPASKNTHSATITMKYSGTDPASSGIDVPAESLVGAWSSRFDFGPSKRDAS